MGNCHVSEVSKDVGNWANAASLKNNYNNNSNTVHNYLIKELFRGCFRVLSLSTWPALYFGDSSLGRSVTFVQAHLLERYLFLTGKHQGMVKLPLTVAPPFNSKLVFLYKMW